MDISVTRFKLECLRIIKSVEKNGRSVAITRRGKVVARLHPSGGTDGRTLKPWEQLRGLGGRLLDEPGGSVLTESELKAPR